MNVYDQTINVLSELHIDTLGATIKTRLKEDLEMDSTELVEMAVALEKHFAISIDDTIFLRLSTLGDITQYIESSLESTTVKGR